MRLLPLALLSLVALPGCSAFGDDLESADGVVLVGIGEGPDDGPAVRLRTEEAYPCGARLVVSSREIEVGVRATVEGIDLSGIGCEAADAPLYAFAELPAAAPTVDVEVRHRGETDLYRQTCGFAGCTFEAVRTSTTRLEP